MTDPTGFEPNTNTARLMLREVWSTGDLALIDELIADHHVHHDPLLQEPIEGPEGLKEWVGTVLEGTPDLTKTANGTYVDDDAVIVPYTATGTHEGEILGITPTGRSIEIDGVYVFHGEDGTLEETLDMWDAFGLFSQIGALPEGL